MPQINDVIIDEHNIRQITVKFDMIDFRHTIFVSYSIPEMREFQTLTKAFTDVAELCELLNNLQLCIAEACAKYNS